MKVNIDKLASELLDGKRKALAKSITLIESKKIEHRKVAKELLEKILPHSGKSIRIGISGVPGVGKSTFIEALGLHLIDKGYRVAVLAIDPTSQISGGSILGDKTRMEALSRNDSAFVRPSPSGGSLGGVARKTRESMFLCEANGYNIIIVETVGVGQSEIKVASMVDFFLLMQLPNAGDELQGIKRGVMEVANAIIINKADSDNMVKAQLAKKQMESALSFFLMADEDWKVPVLLVSALERKGIDNVWEVVEKYIHVKKSSGKFFYKRKRQAIDWMWTTVYEDIKEMLLENKNVADLAIDMEKAVVDNKITPSFAADAIIERFKESICLEGGL